MGLKLLKESMRECRVMTREGGYQYFTHPLSDGVPHICKELLEEVVDEILHVADMECNKIVTVEAMGIPLAVTMTCKTGIPSVIVRKRPYGFPEEVVLAQNTGYGGVNLYVNGLEKGDRIVLVDDVVSTGGTLAPLVEALEDLGVDIVDIIMVFNKTKDIEVIEKLVGHGIKYLVKVDVVGGKVIISG